jgi:hypothetical protein
MMVTAVSAAAAGLILLGTFLGWAGGIDAMDGPNGLDGGYITGWDDDDGMDGILSLTGGLAVLGLALARVFDRTPASSAAVAITGMLAAAAGGFNIARLVEDVADYGSFGDGLEEIGPGLWLVTAGGLAAAISGFAGTLQKSSRRGVYM